LSLDCIAIGRQDELFLWKEVDLSLCGDGPVEIVSDPAADSSLGVVEREVGVKERQ